MIEAFIFDLDGTLLDSEIVWVEAYRELMRGLGRSITREEALSVVYGKAYQEVYAETLSQVPTLDWTSQEMAGHFRAVFRDLAQQRDLRIHNSIELLKRLARQFPVCVVSGACRADVDEGVRLAGVGSALRFALGQEDYGAGKPNPAGFLLATQRLGVKPPCCLVFEDSAAGVRAAKAAGMYCVALARPERPPQDLSQADLIYDDLAKFSLADLTL